LTLKICCKKQSIKDYIGALRLKNVIPGLKSSFLKSSMTEKIFTLIMFIFSIYFVCITGVFNFKLPTYADDSF
jgi:hypothetical protein